MRIQASFGLYLTDIDSEEAQRRMSAHPRVWLTPQHRAEWTQAVAQGVFRGTISNDEARQVYAAFEDDREAGLRLEVGLPETTFETAIDLARRHGARIGIRTVDSLHVASVLELRAKRFWTLDVRQAPLARAEGLRIS
jgi:PIN domain